MLFDDDELGRAIVFFGPDDKICKEMHSSEFEAVLDGYVPLKDWSNRHLKAAYVEMDSDYLVHTAVFFLVGFTEEGEVDPDWNLPLDALARNASEGPDLGAGPIRLACASQCPIHHFRQYLWDPDLRKNRGPLAALKKAIKANKLSIQFRDPSEERKQEMKSREALIDAGIVERRLAEQIRREYTAELRTQMAQILKEQRLKDSASANEMDKEIKTLKVEHANQMEAYRKLVLAKEEELKEAQTRNQMMQITIDGQAKKIEGLREYFEHKLEKSQGEEAEELTALKENYAAEMQAKIEAATTELKQMLQMREVELLYRNERESQLHEEITRLRAENQELVSNSGDRLLEKMMAKGVSFVTYQPGAGHITIPASEMSRFMESPLAYAAHVCGVNEDHYNAWLEHYQAPVCNAMDSEGGCGENIDRIANPADFHIGIGDRCDKHREIKGAKLTVISGKS